MKCSVIILLLISHLTSIAQNSTGLDSVMNRIGVWKKINDEGAFPDKTFPRSQYKFIHARIDTMNAMLKEAVPDLHGCEPRWLRNITGQAYIPNGPVPYELTTQFFLYFFSDILKKTVLGDETSTAVHIFVNHLSWFLQIADTLDINNDGKIRTVCQLPPKDGQIQGMTVYKLKVSQFYSGSAIIIGRNGKLPWRTITQGQYLTGLRNKYKRQVLSYRKGSSNESDYQSRIKYIDDYLSVTDDQILKQPAIIDPKAGIWGFKGKFGSEDAGGTRLVLFAGSEAYFDKNLPRYVPQLIQLFWSYQSYPVSQNIKSQFEKNFRMDKLKAMIDK